MTHIQTDMQNSLFFLSYNKHKTSDSFFKKKLKDVTNLVHIKMAMNQGSYTGTDQNTDAT